MEPFKTLTGIVAPLDRINVDTDQIIPKQFLKLVERSGYGQYLFYDWRLERDGTRKPDFVLNQPRYKSAKILLSRANFGCGSSREHAVWALLDYGFKALIASSYADIFYGNCFKNGVLPISLNEEEINRLFEEAANQEGYSLEIDLERQTIRKPSGDTVRFEVDHFRKKCLLEGLDDIALTLEHEEEIRAYEQRLKRFLLVRG